ncbi:MAG: 2OG-Fe(II) oxygenase [Candidatus Rokuibacteriota bacterium]
MPARGLIRAPSLQTRLQRIAWNEVSQALDDRGWATTPPLLTAAECAELIRLYPEERRFRSRVDMARFRFGEGEYKYFANPLPPVVLGLRRHAYPHLAPIASGWENTLGAERRYPAELDEFLAVCAEHGQTKPTPLLLRYEAGGYNCLHHDLYGDVAFPLQMTCLLSRPGQDFTGGEFLLVEQRPRAQSTGSVVPLERGQIVIFATRHRPARGARGAYRVTLRHGVSRVASGERYTLGVIFHDAK